MDGAGLVRWAACGARAVSWLGAAAGWLQPSSLEYGIAKVVNMKVFARLF